MKVVVEKMFNGRKLQVFIDGDTVSLPYIHDANAPPFTASLTVPDYVKQVFSYRRADDGIWLHYDIAKLHGMFNAEPDAYYRYDQTIMGQNVRQIMKDNGIEKAHITRKRRDVEWLNTPGILMHWPDEQSTFLDGNHKFVARYMAGLRFMSIWNPTYEQCKPAMLFLPVALVPKS